MICVRCEGRQTLTGDICQRCRGEMVWDRYVDLVQEHADRSPPPSAEELGATAAALVAVRDRLQKTLEPVRPPVEIALFISRYGQHGGVQEGHR